MVMIGNRLYNYCKAVMIRTRSQRSLLILLIRDLMQKTSGLHFANATSQKIS